MEEFAIRAENISKKYRLYERKSDRLKEALSVLKRKQYYKDFYALNDVSFNVKKGETVGIIGTNGSGKSTLLKILTGVSVPSSGSFEVHGRISALLELGTGFNPEYTGIENIMLNGTMMGYTEEQIESRKQSIIDFADIGEYIHQPVKNYSSGMFARLAFAVAISVEPEILIVDETLSVGDMRFQIKCMDYMKKMMENGTTILLVSHDINAIRRFCQRALWLNKGKQMAFDETNHVADQYIDFLKRGYESENPQVVFNKKTNKEEDQNISRKKETIADIVGFEVTPVNGTEFSYGEILYNEPVKVTVTYDVYDTELKNPVLGVALFTADGEYICGLNTLLDNVHIPWQFGRNTFSLVYSEGLCVLGGRYYFDCALIDQTASVFIVHKKYMNEIKVNSGYKAEGKLIIPHQWKE